MNDQVENVHNDLLLVQEVFGSEFIYEKHGTQLLAISFDDKGDENARYLVKVSLKKQ